MISKNLIFVHGHFYDRNTQKRVTLQDGANIYLVAAQESFSPVVPIGKLPEELLNTQDKEEAVRTTPGLEAYKKIGEAGDYLYFTINRKEGEIVLAHEFKVLLLEDLYLFLKREWKNQEDRLFDCACVVKENISNTITYFEEINAGSLNEAFKNTYVHFFGNEGNPSSNAIERFYERTGDKESSLMYRRDEIKIARSNSTGSNE
jgi:hypothetical protein